LVVKDKVGARDVIVCNQVSFLEYIFLEKEYGPAFTQVAYKNGRFGFRKLGLFEIPMAAFTQIFKQMDGDRNGILNEDEFRELLIQMRVLNKEEDLIVLL